MPVTLVDQVDSSLGEQVKIDFRGDTEYSSNLEISCKETTRINKLYITC